ncbi:MAG: DUF420 domain-containing protein [Pirellulales bacterium]
MEPSTAHWLVHLNATLNAIAAVLLLVGYVLIKQRREVAHQRVMLSAFAVSTAFLISYLVYHYQVGSVKFTYPGPVRYVYYPILLTHVMLAITVPPLALATIYYGLKSFGWRLPRDTAAADIPALLLHYRARHRWIAWITFPIWMYVSVTGVVVYAMLYHLFPPAPVAL